MTLAPPPLLAFGSDLGRHPLVGSPHLSATLPDATPYPGDLLEDILAYRDLRVHAVRGLELDEAARASFRTLERRLRSHDDDDDDVRLRANLRAYHRFDVALGARLRLRNETGSQLLDVSIENISAGGVKLRGNHGCTAGQSVWLLVPRGDRKVVVLPARVAWVREDTGLMFAGAATC